MTHKFNLLFLTSLLLIACADESPMESVYRDVSAAERQYAEDQEYQRERQEKQRQQQICILVLLQFRLPVQHRQKFVF